MYLGKQEKAALLAEVDANDSIMRRLLWRRGIPGNVLYNWRSAQNLAPVAAGMSDNVTFVPVGVIDETAPGGPALLVLSEPRPASELAPLDGNAGLIEIVLPGGARISVDASVN